VPPKGGTAIAKCPVTAIAKFPGTAIAKCPVTAIAKFPGTAIVPLRGCKSSRV